MYFICSTLSSQAGQLNEYTERREMSAEVSCLSLATVPPGEQRSRFLAIGLADQTVRIISLDPTVSDIVCILDNVCQYHNSHSCYTAYPFNRLQIK